MSISAKTGRRTQISASQYTKAYPEQERIEGKSTDNSRLAAVHSKKKLCKRLAPISAGKCITER
jgi:hypothetical protein